MAKNHRRNCRTTVAQIKLQRVERRGKGFDVTYTAEERANCLREHLTRTPGMKLFRRYFSPPPPNKTSFRKNILPLFEAATSISPTPLR